MGRCDSRFAQVEGRGYFVIHGFRHRQPHSKINWQDCEPIRGQVELLADDAKVNATVSLLGCELGYGDPREVPEVTAKYGGANYEAFISIRSHNGLTLLFEIRSTTASKIAAL